MQNANDISTKLAKTLFIFLLSISIPFLLIYFYENLYYATGIYEIQIFGRFGLEFFIFENIIFPLVFCIMAIYGVWKNKRINFYILLFALTLVYNFFITFTFGIKNPSSIEEYILIKRYFLILFGSIILSYITILIKDKI